MNREPSPDMSWRKLLIPFVAAALGVGLGTFVGPWLVDRYRDSPPWLLPVLVLGCAVLAVIAALVVRAAMGRRSAANPET